MADALVLDGVSKIYEVGGVELVALHEVDLTVAEEEVVTLLGPSGSGKTTLLSIAGGLLSPTSGKVVVGGKNITRARARKLTAFRRKRIGFIFQAVNLVPFLTARENLLVVAELARRDRGAAGHRADRLLEELGLGHRMNNLPSQLSGGERQRVAIGRALMNQPALVLVDEPTSALDSDLGQQVMELIVSEVKARGAAAVIVTHDQRMARYGDQILTMADGRIAGMAPRPEFTLGRGPAPAGELEPGRGLRALPAAASGQYPAAAGYGPGGVVGPPSGRVPAAGGVGRGPGPGGRGPGTGQWPAAAPDLGPDPGTGQWPASARDASGFGPGPGHPGPQPVHPRHPGTGQWPATAPDVGHDPGTGQWPASARDGSGLGPDPGTGQWPASARDQGHGPGPGQWPATARGGPGTGQQPAARDTSGFDDFWSDSRDRDWPGTGQTPAARGRPPTGQTPVARGRPPTGSQPPVSTEVPVVLPAPDRQWRRPTTPPRNQPPGRRPPPQPPVPPHQPPPQAPPHAFPSQWAEPQPPGYEPNGFDPGFEVPAARHGPVRPEPSPAWGTPEFFADPPPQPDFFADPPPQPGWTPPALRRVAPEPEPEGDGSDRARWLQQLTPPPTKAQPRPLALPDRPIWPTDYWGPHGQGGPDANGHHPDEILDADVVEDGYDFDYGEYEDDR